MSKCGINQDKTRLTTFENGLFRLRSRRESRPASHSLIVLICGSFIDHLIKIGVHPPQKKRAEKEVGGSAGSAKTEKIFFRAY
jgi:hypothetical protein